MVVRQDFIVGVRKRRPVVETLGHKKFGPNVVVKYLKLYIYIVRAVVGSPREAPWRQREATEASSCAQILAQSGNLVLYQRR